MPARGSVAVRGGWRRACDFKFEPFAGRVDGAVAAGRPQDSRWLNYAQRTKAT